MFSYFGHQLDPFLPVWTSMSEISDNWRCGLLTSLILCMSRKPVGEGNSWWGNGPLIKSSSHGLKNIEKCWFQSIIFSILLIIIFHFDSTFIVYLNVLFKKKEVFKKKKPTWELTQTNRILTICLYWQIKFSNNSWMLY